MGDYIVTWDTRFAGSYHASLAALRQRAHQAGVVLPEVMGTAPGPVLSAFVNNGRWLVLCPSCYGAECAREDERFLCEGCWNADAGRQWLPAVFPPERADVEMVLLQRPAPRNRNWRGPWAPQETVDDLRREQAANMGQEV